MYLIGESVPVEFLNAFYIKLGRGGCWETDSIRSSRLRLGWVGQSVNDINAGRWDVISEQLRNEMPDKPQVATNDLNRLRDIAQSTPEDLWITFHGAKLWWARLAAGRVEEDHISKYRGTLDGWRDTSLSGKLLVVNDLPGKIAQLQGFRGTACRVLEQALLRRVLEGTRSELASRIAHERASLCLRLEIAITELHWKDYETLVDLVFRNAGWKRVSVLGQQAKGYDLELREPITGDRYVVQVKSQANRADLDNTILEFSAADYRKVFFVVHSPTSNLVNAIDLPNHVELVDPTHLAKLALDAGLSTWIEEKVA
jgi:Restriction endonuclease